MKTKKPTEDQLYRALAYVLQRAFLSMPEDATESDQYFHGGVLKGICIGFSAASAELDCPEGCAAALKHAKQIVAEFGVTEG